MEPCRSVSARVPFFRSPASTTAAKPRSAVSSVTAGPLPLRHLSDHYATEDTLKHLISTIEQLKSKDKVISQLERELGHPAAFAGPVSMATEVTRTSSSGQHSNKMETPPLSPHKVLSGLSQVFQTLHGTTVASFPLGGEEKGAVEVFAGLEAELQGLHDRAQALALDRQTLLDKVKECEAKNKQLVERNRRFLEKNVELTAQNRSLKDGNHTLQQQHKKTRDEAEEGRRKLCELARELQRVKGHNLELEAQVQQMEELKTQLADQTASITLLRQACTDKDRRIELIQHRKKRRRLIRSQEKCQGVKETFYGYDDDENDVSIDSENSQSSVSVSTISEEDACDELSREELERSHRQMLREHLQLERSHALLQAHAGSSQDPYRELQTRSQLQADLFSAQCRVELLEKEIRSLQSSARRRRSSGAGVDADVDVDIRALLTERDELLAARHSLRHKLEQVDGECARLRQELRQAEERAEDLEFRMLELEENRPADDQHSQDDDLHLHHGSDLDKRDLDRHDLDENVRHRDDEARDCDGAQKATVTECLTQAAATTAASPSCLPAPAPAPLSPAQRPAAEAEVSMDLQKLRRELTTALERHGVKADAVLKSLGSLKDAEQKVASMERMAMELQKKVITLQQERDHLEEKLMRGAPISVTAEVERRQNLELKEEITRLTRAEEESRSESSRLSQQLEDSENLCLSLRELLESAGQTDVCNSALLSGSGQNRTDLQKAGEEDQGRLQREDRGTQTEKVEEAGEGQTRPPSGSQSEARWTQTESMNGETYLPNKSESEARWTQTESMNGETHLPNRSEREAKWTQTESTNGETHLPNKSESEAKWTQTESTNGETPHLPDRSESEAKWTQTESRNGETYLPSRSESETKWTQTESRNRDKKARSRSGEKERAELQSLARKVEALQQQLKKLEAENQQLAEKASGRNTDSSSDEDDPLHPALKHKPQQKVKTLERQLKVLHSENLRLADKLGGYAPSGNRHDPDEIIERIVELEDFCTDLQDRVREAEGHERQMREKLRLAEQTINELESSEAQYRDKCDELWKQERETRKQLHSLQATGRELREIILDKDIVEQALTEKVEFLEKVEAQSSQRIQELEALERSYREQLESRDSAHSPGADSRSLQDKLAAAEREIEKLVARNNELEENEEILRENWRRVADEDANRLQCLEEKVRMLTLANQDLKHKVAEAQDFVVINSGPAKGSLADELSASSKRGQARSHGDGPMSGGSDDDSGDESPRKRVTKLKRQLSILEEEKNGKIANLQERVAELRENEIKLSETLAEMEMTERELRAKLALYESSEVTVEKMIKYQDKIHELKTSQESLLDQLETMETQEETLQEKLEDTERRLKGRIVTLEVELKNLKQKENKGNARIRELEKHEEELTEKTKIQAEKENGLYVRISGLMDQVKERTARVSELEKKLAEKEERCRKVASLETKFLQIEGAYRDKVNALESSLAEAQSTLEEQQKQHEETRASLEERLASLEESLVSRDKEHNQRVFILEEMFAQKEQGLNERISSLENSVAERDRTISRYDRELGEKDDRICELERDLSERDSKLGELETLVSSKESKESELEKTLKAKDDRISELEKDVSRRDAQISKLERGLSERDSHVTELDKDLCDKHARLGDLEKELSEKQACISELERDVSEKVSRIGELEMELGTKESRISEAEKDLSDFNRLQGDLSEKDARINELEENLSSRISHISDLEQDLAKKSSRIEELEQDLGRKISHISELEQDLSSKVSRISQLEEDLGEKNSQISQLEKDLGDRGSEVRQLEKDLSKKDESLCEMERAVVEKDSCISRLERELDDKVSIISRLEKDLGDRVSCISRLEKDLGDKVSCISRLEKDLGDKVSCISRLEKDLGDKVSRVRQLEAELEDRERQIGDLETRLEALESETSDRLEQAQRDNTSKDNHIAQMEERVIDMSSTISQLQQEAADKDLRVSALEKRLADNDTVVAEHVSQLQMELETKQKSSTDTVSSLEKELAAAKTQLSQTEAKSSESSRQLAALQAELEEERACVRAVKERQEALEAERDRVQSELSAKVSELEGRLKEEGLHFQTQMSVRESQFQQACASLDAECESLRGEVMEKNMVIEKLESNKNELLSKIESLKDRERDLANRISVLEADFGSLHAQKDEELKHVVSSLENRLENTQREKETAEEKLYSLEAELQSSNETIAQQLQEMSRLESDTRQAKSQVETLQEQLSELRSAEVKNSAQADALLQQEVMLKSRMAQVEMQLEASSKNTKDQEASMSALLRQKQDLEAALVKVGADLSDSHKLNAQLQETVHELTSRTRSLQQEVADLTKELASHQAREQEIHELLAREKGRLQDLEAQISSLKEEKESAVAEAERLGRELAHSRETVARLENQIVGMDKDEASLKSQIAAEQSAKQDLDNRLSEMSEEVRVSKERVAQLQKAAGEREEEVERLKADLVSRSHQLESQQQATSGVEQKDKELEELRRREKALKGRETTLQNKIASLEGQMGRYQEEHSQMCHKLQELEKREKELLEQITDIEQTVIVPLEAENSELKEEIQSLKQQNESLNLQMDKQEEQAREDSEELDALRKSVSDLQISRTEIQSKLDIVSRELTEKESENETLQAKLLDVETVNTNLQDELDNNRVEIDKIALEFNKELCSRDTQTDWDVPAWEAERQVLQSKVTVLQDAEDKFMSRIVELEEREQQLSEELLSARRLVQEKDLCARQTQTDDFLSQTRPSPPDTADASANTDGLQEPNTAKVPELFARVQELEVANHQLMSSLEQATAGEVDRRQLTEKLQLLEQAEDRLMERVMELEENEVALRTQLDRTRYRAKVADELEEEVSVLLQQEDEWKDKEAALTAQSSALSRQLEQLQNQLAVEQSRNDGLSRQVETEQRQLHDAQKELRVVQTKLQAVRSEYEEKLSALEESEKKMENQLHSRSQEDSDLRQEMQVLREEMEDVCERYKELEQENSTLKQQHAKAQLDLKDAEARCLQTTGQVSREPTLLTAQAQTQLATLPPGASASLSLGADPDQQLSPPRVCSTLSLQMVQSSDLQDGAQTSAREESLLARIAELEKELSRAGRPGSGGGLRFVQDSVDSVGSEPTWDEQGDSDSSGFHSAPASQQSVKILTLSSALEENAALKAQLRDLQSRSATPSQHLQPQSSADGEKLSSAAVAELQGEVSALQRRVAELEQSLAAAEGAVQEVVTVIRTRSVHTLEQKIETIQQTIHTQSPAWPLHQELLELLTTQADLQKQVSHLMETEHNLRTALKQAEDELSRVKSGAGATTLSARRAETERRLGIHSRLSRFGGGTASSRAPGDTDQTHLDSGNREKQQWLERQVADLQLAKSSLERRLHEAERRLAFRPRPTSASREELLFRIDQLQREQGEWRKKVEDLEALNSHYLKEKLELAQDRNALEQKLQELGPGVGKEVNVVFVGGTREEPLGSSGSVSEGEPCADPATTAANMLEKPEDVLQKRIKELENVENYLRQQLSEMEADRDQLHEIARKDKAMIHEQNVRLRELMLQERNLRSQVSGLEDSERSLYNRCSELEDNVTRLEDRVHELEVHERRLRELVRKLKLDEEVWLSKSGDLTSSMEQLSSSEVSLRKLVQDLQIEKGGLSDRTEYLEARVKELEGLEATLVQRLKNYENMEASMQSRLHHLENSEAAAYSKASELDVINMDLSSRLQRAVEENAVLSQHVAQQQGQIHELDRKLSAATDAEVGLNQHVESLQKSEASLQKKVREYELRDIDAQARIRELEQMEEILKDKVNQLQRSENRLKSRLVEFETVGSQMLEDLPPTQRQQLPQKLEDCQKRVVVLQRQLEAAQAELHRPQPAEDYATSVKVPTAALAEMRTKVALLEETEYQMSELEKLNAQLNQNILLLQQGKGSCGHEVELEVLKRRLHSYQNLIQKLKHYLSEGQVPSLWATDTVGQGPESEDLPARDVQRLESERALHSVRSLTKPPGLPPAQEERLQASSSGTLHAGRAQGVASVPSEPEESHWRTVELRRDLAQGAELRGASASMPHASATAPPRQEELMIGLSLASESERGSFKSQNDTDSEMSGAPHPHLRVVGSTPRVSDPLTSDVVPSSGVGGRTDSHHPPMPTTTTTATTWAPATPPLAQQRQTNAAFAQEDSFYLPSSVPSESESMEDDEAPPLPASAPPGMSASAMQQRRSQPASAVTTPVARRTFVSAVTMPSVGQGSAGVEGPGAGEAGTQKRLQTTSVVGLSIRQRIAQIEKQLKEKPSPKAGSKEENEDVFTWKAKAVESARLLTVAERESKQLKEDINKLEKDLEEKRRYMDIFEKWILDAEEVLKNKNKKNDRDLVQQLQTEVKHLKQDLGNAGYRKDDIFTDPAALKTELDRRERELSTKQSELDSMAEEVQRWRQECNNVEMMRSNALDALRLLETEVTQLQDADIQLKQMKDEYNRLRGQYDEVNVQKNKAVAAVHALRAKVARLAKKCQEKDEILRRLSEDLRGGRGRSSSLLEELSRLEVMAGGEEYNRPLSPLDLITGPLMSDTERLLSERIPDSTFTRWPSSSSLGDPRDFASSADLLRSGDRSSLRRPKSAEQIRTGQQGVQPPGQFSGIGSALGYGGESLCVAILDYQPDTASRSGHRHLELPLKEGDQVRIRGPVDRFGYCEAEVGGRTGLVPASHLYPLTDNAATYRPASQPHGRHKKSGGDSAEQIVQMFDELQDSRLVSGVTHNHSSQPSQHAAHSTATQTRQRRSVTKSHLAPEAPTNLRIEEVEGNSLVLAWQPPPLDQHGCSNGSKVVGYRIYLNGRVCQQPHSPRLSRTRVEGVRHDRPQQLAIQTLAASGQVSSRLELIYQGVKSPPARGDSGEDGEADTDLSSILNSIHYKTGRKRTMMGLYDYDPEKQSPGDYTACELAFHAGDILLVYGEERPDGFFHGERNGQRGLVPACFVEPVTQGGKSAQKHSAANGPSCPGS